MAKQRQKYTLNGELVPGVTTILSQEESGGLIIAAHRMGIDGKQIHGPEGEWDRASAIGQCAHQMIQDHIQGTQFTPDPEEYNEEVVRLAQAPFENFLRWFDAQKGTVSGQCELSLVHPDGFGGTLDLLGADGTLYDWKTSSRHLFSYGLSKVVGQVSAYKYLAGYHGHEIHRVKVVRFDKKAKTIAQEYTLAKDDPKLAAGLDLFFGLFAAHEARKIINRKTK